MDQFDEIFQAMVHDHGQRPRNFGEFEGATHRAEGVNPLTGDRIEVFAEIDSDQIIRKLTFTGKASSLATTSASVMTGALIGKSLLEALDSIVMTLQLISGDAAPPANLPENEYSLLLEIRNYPHRVRCVALAWNTAKSALSK